jgi:ribosomal protein L19E
MSLTTRSLKKVKQRIAKKLKCGSSRVKFTSKSIAKLRSMNEITSINSQVINEIIKNKQIRIEPIKNRLYKIYNLKGNKKQRDAVQLDLQHKISDLKQKQLSKAQKSKLRDLEKFNDLRLKYGVEDKYKNVKSLNYLKKRKITTDKKIWIEKTRSLRRCLSQNKHLCEKVPYRIIRNKIKSNRYKNTQELIRDLQ